CVEGGWRWCRRNPVVAGSLGTAAAALVAVAGLSLLYANRQARDAAQIKQMAAEKTTESLKAQQETRRANLRLALLNYDRGQAACEAGGVGPGLLWLIESWRSAVDARGPHWQHGARAHLAPRAPPTPDAE